MGRHFNVTPAGAAVLQCWHDARIACRVSRTVRRTMPCSAAGEKSKRDWINDRGPAAECKPDAEDSGQDGERRRRSVRAMDGCAGKKREEEGGCVWCLVCQVVIDRRGQRSSERRLAGRRSVWPPSVGINAGRTVFSAGAPGRLTTSTRAHIELPRAVTES